MPAFFALAGALLGVIASQWTTRRTIDAAKRNAEDAINQKANEIELAELRSRLEGFYGPYQQLSEENRLLAEEFRSRQSDSDIRTLLKLLDPDWFPQLSKSDQTIVEEIIRNGRVLRDLIRTKSGLADPAALPYLARPGTHFTLLTLAKEGALTNSPDRFAIYTYPHQLDGVLRAETERLKARVNILRSAPARAHGPLEPLILPEALALPPWPKSPRS